ncbi:MAG: rRNA maturation RNase YbeY [Gammaproteobacteria bacterium]|nr:rRNA maturation RNase YbeY [Gammaproteobacteria bacterium]
MAIILDLQNESAATSMPAAKQVRQWLKAALQADYARLEQTIRVVDESESRTLNQHFRDRDSATNVLAFPADSDLLDYDCLGDLVICAPLVVTEAKAQGKSEDAHWAHLVIHGMLHLQGYDHQTEAQAACMEALEVEILDTLGYTNPYND